MTKETLHIYTRVSTDVQEDKGTSLDSQKALGIKKAKELGLKHKVWNEGGASSNYEDFQNRPVLLELIGKIEEGKVSHLWVYNNDRLSRNAITAQTIRVALQKHGVTLYTQDGKFDLNNPQDNFLKTVLDGVAQLDNAMRAERTRLGKLHKIKQGNWMGGPAPYGYQSRDKKLVPHPEERKWIKQIYEWYRDKKSTQWIKSQLDKAGVLTRHRKGNWTLGSLQKILQNTHYVGRYTYTDSKTGEVIQCECPALISATLWNECQKIRKRTLKRKGQNNRTQRFYLLRNLMYCSHCGSHMAGRIIERKYERHYYCPKKERSWVKKAPNDNEKWMRGKGCDMTRSLNIPQTDELVWDAVTDVVSKSHRIKEGFKKEILESKFLSDKESETEKKKENIKQKRLSKELKGIQDNIADVQTAKILGKQDKEISKKVLDNLYQELDRTKEKIEQSKIRVSELSDRQKWVDWVERFQGKAKKMQNFTDEEKKEYLEGIISQIDVSYNQADNLHELVIHFKIPMVDDKLKYNNPDKKSEGYKIRGGKKDVALKVKKNDEISENQRGSRSPLSTQPLDGGVNCHAMDLNHAQQIAKSLASGINPLTGEVIEDHDILVQPDIIRALFVLAHHVPTKAERRAAQNAVQGKPKNAGKRWEETEDEALTELFTQEKTIAQIAEKFERTKGSVRSRLVKLGLIEDEAQDAA